jgi:hypothetical protein
MSTDENQPPRQTQRRIRMWKIEDGRPVPYIFETEDMEEFGWKPVLVREYPDRALMEAEARMAENERRVADGVARSPGNVVTESALRTVARWTVSSIENPIPGSDDLRTEYFAERKVLEDRYREEDEECPACKLGELLRKYFRKLKTAELI